VEKALLTAVRHEVLDDAIFACVLAILVEAQIVCALLCDLSRLSFVSHTQVTTGVTCS
jgi:hypothetical protein